MARWTRACAGFILMVAACKMVAGNTLRRASAASVDRRRHEVLARHSAKGWVGAAHGSSDRRTDRRDLGRDRTDRAHVHDHPGIGLGEFRAAGERIPAAQFPGQAFRDLDAPHREDAHRLRRAGDRVARTLVIALGVEDELEYIHKLNLVLSSRNVIPSFM